MSENNRLSRIYSIDALRGLVIIIMLLDHVRETFYLHKQVGDPIQIEQVEPALFWSRAFAHLCAPVFVLLTGMSAFLFQNKTQSIAQTREFLFKRGLFLVILELSLVNFAWTAQFPPSVIYLQVIWAIGLSMIALALCIGLSKKMLFGLGLVIIFGHNLLDGVSFSGVPFLEPVWMILHERGWLEWGWIRIRTSYPILPWIGVIFLGYCLGQLYSSGVSAKLRQRWLISLGLGSITLFIVLRLINGYGDFPWQSYTQAQDTLMSFFNLNKYPPSLFFILWNVGVGLLILAIFERLNESKLIQFMLVFGSVPMFFYLLHLYVLKLLYVICVAIWGIDNTGYFHVDHVASLWLITVVLTLLLYPVVKAFSNYKHRNKQIKWLKYI